MKINFAKCKVGFAKCKVGIYKYIYTTSITRHFLESIRGFVFLGIVVPNFIQQVGLVMFLFERWK